MSGTVISLETLKKTSAILTRAKAVNLAHLFSTHNVDIKLFHFKKLAELLSAHGLSFDALEDRGRRSRALLRLPGNLFPSVRDRILKEFSCCDDSAKKTIKAVFNAVDHKKPSDVKQLTGLLSSTFSSAPKLPSNVFYLIGKRTEEAPSPRC